MQDLFAPLIGADADEVFIPDCTGAGSSLAMKIVDGFRRSNVVFDTL
ncbi:MAG: hypothetical protein OXF41_09895 [bacterium]|nr:hypothetical protein [bacterium]